MRVNVITVQPCHWKNKINPPCSSLLGVLASGRGAPLSLLITQRFNWLSCHYLDCRSGSSLWFPLADGSATIFFLTSMNWLKIKRESLEMFSFWHSTCNPQKLSTVLAEQLSQRRSEPKLQTSLNPASLDDWKQCIFLFWKGLKIKRKKETHLCCLTLLHTLTPLCLVRFLRARWLQHFSGNIMSREG